VHFNVFSVNVIARIILHLGLITLSINNLFVVLFYFSTGLTALLDFKGQLRVFVGYLYLPFHLFFLGHEFIDSVLDHCFLYLSLLEHELFFKLVCRFMSGKFVRLH